MIEPEKGKFYKVKVINKKFDNLFNRTVKVKFTGIMMRGKNPNNSLYLSDCEILNMISEQDFNQ